MLLLQPHRRHSHHAPRHVSRSGKLSKASLEVVVPSILISCKKKTLYAPLNEEVQSLEKEQFVLFRRFRKVGLLTYEVLPSCNV